MNNKNMNDKISICNFYIKNINDDFLKEIEFDDIIDYYNYSLSIDNKYVKKMIELNIEKYIYYCINNDQVNDQKCIDFFFEDYKKNIDTLCENFGINKDDLKIDKIYNDLNLINKKNNNNLYNNIKDIIKKKISKNKKLNDLEEIYTNIYYQLNKNKIDNKNECFYNYIKNNYIQKKDLIVNLEKVKEYNLKNDELNNRYLHKLYFNNIPYNKYFFDNIYNYDKYKTFIVAKSLNMIHIKKYDIYLNYIYNLQRYFNKKNYKELKYNDENNLLYLKKEFLLIMMNNYIHSFLIKNKKMIIENNQKLYNILVKFLVDKDEVDYDIYKYNINILILHILYKKNYKNHNKDITLINKLNIYVDIFNHYYVDNDTHFLLKAINYNNVIIPKKSILDNFNNLSCFFTIISSIFYYKFNIKFKFITDIVDNVIEYKNEQFYFEKDFKIEINNKLKIEFNKKDFINNNNIFENRIDSLYNLQLQKNENEKILNLLNIEIEGLQLTYERILILTSNDTFEKQQNSNLKDNILNNFYYCNLFFSYIGDIIKNKNINDNLILKNIDPRKIGKVKVYNLFIKPSDYNDNKDQEFNLNHIIFFYLVFINIYIYKKHYKTEVKVNRGIKEDINYILSEYKINCHTQNNNNIYILNKEDILKNILKIHFNAMDSNDLNKLFIIVNNDNYKYVYFFICLYISHELNYKNFQYLYKTFYTKSDNSKIFKNIDKYNLIIKTLHEIINNIKKDIFNINSIIENLYISSIIENFNNNFNKILKNIDYLNKSDNMNNIYNENDFITSLKKFINNNILDIYKKTKDILINRDNYYNNYKLFNIVDDEIIMLNLDETKGNINYNLDKKLMNDSVFKTNIQNINNILNDIKPKKVNVNTLKNLNNIIIKKMENINNRDKSIFLLHNKDEFNKLSNINILFRNNNDKKFDLLILNLYDIIYGNIENNISTENILNLTLNNKKHINNDKIIDIYYKKYISNLYHYNLNCVKIDKKNFTNYITFLNIIDTKNNLLNLLSQIKF